MQAQQTKMQKEFVQTSLKQIQKLKILKFVYLNLGKWPFCVKKQKAIKLITFKIKIFFIC